FGPDSPCVSGAAFDQSKRDAGGGPARLRPSRAPARAAPARTASNPGKKRRMVESLGFDGGDNTRRDQPPGHPYGRPFGLGVASAPRQLWRQRRGKSVSSASTPRSRASRQFPDSLPLTVGPARKMRLPA